MMNSLPSGPTSGGLVSQARPKSARTLPVVVNATSGDHPAVVQFLTSECPDWSTSRVMASFDHPHYEPPDRLLIKVGSRPIAHAHVTRHSMQFGATRLPVGELQYMLVSPEFRHHGFGEKLLDASVRQMASHGSLIALARTSSSGFFEKSGWAVIGTDCRSTVATRSLLSEMHAQELVPKRHRGRLNVRLARRIELEAIDRIHQRNLPGTFGPRERTGPVWQWLVDNQACEQFFVAATGPVAIEAEDPRSEIVAYAVVHCGKILELFTLPSRRAAAIPMLVRLCREGIEQNHRNITFYAPAADCHHALFCQAGGRTEEKTSDATEVIMARALSPAKLLRAMGPELLRRAEAAELELPCRWNLAIDRRTYVVTLDTRGTTVTTGSEAENGFTLTNCDFTLLVLGQLDWAAAHNNGRLTIQGDWMKQAGAILFPSLPLWCPPLDSLSAIGL